MSDIVNGLPSQLSESDLRLLKAATEEVKASQSVYNFVSRYLGPIYQIDSQCSINTTTGEISRPVATPALVPPDKARLA